MQDDDATRRLERLERVRALAGSVLHAGRRAVTPELRGRRGHSTIISSATYSPWAVDQRFREVVEQIRANTLLDEMRLHELWQLAGQVGGLSGDAIEVGCWRGGAGCLAAGRIAASLVLIRAGRQTHRQGQR